MGGVMGGAMRGPNGGAKGGGSDQEQINEIINIAKHIQVDISPQEAKDIAHQLFGESNTFRSGQIGSWKKHFSETDKIAFKKIAGQLLIDLGYEKDFNW